MPLTIVMYHYVRDLARSRYPLIKGRDIAEFRGQLDHIARHHHVVTTEAVVEAVKGGEPLPANAAWLTFDDGYLEHFTQVFPLLHERGWQGAFFPPVKTVVDRELLDVNMVHFILAAQPDPTPVIAAIKAYVDTRQGDGIAPFEAYWREFAQAGRFDAAEVIFIKRVLQHALPETPRKALCRQLFRSFVSVDPAAFAQELYMSVDQLRMMVRCGMTVGGHGVNHYWLNRLSPAAQEAEVDASRAFLGSLGVAAKDWVMCYPYGAHDDSLRALLARKDCAIGLTTRVAVAEIGVDAPLMLPRLDTNDLPLTP
ncbi:MAG: polysaccharide deacetylase family protein [Phaeospirillum sp.]|nr:polysaccharide deacetylase family protein [Phaeospirillum sp.]